MLNLFCQLVQPKLGLFTLIPAHPEDKQGCEATMTMTRQNSPPSPPPLSQTTLCLASPKHTKSPPFILIVFKEEHSAICQLCHCVTDNWCVCNTVFKIHHSKYVAVFASVSV